MHELASIGHTLIDAPSGAKIPLHTVADVYEDRSPNFISRENGQRKIVVQRNVAGRDLLGVVREIEFAVNAGDPMPAGYRVEYGGQFESEAEASRRLRLLGGAVILAILLLLASAVQSTRDALIIMLNLPLALVPIAAGMGKPGSEIQAPMAMVILFGLISSTALNMVIVPAIYCATNPPK
ncbi:MAG: efflux RND transporter permease subunit [Bryobacteraceae bacterium]|nr:efflux RND transporter permease subunit [Bryobacteraceae bacterium]